MDQYRVIEMLFRWLGDHTWADGLSVRCDHTTEAKETLGLYVGRKQPGQGRSAQIAQVDLLVCNEKTRKVELIIEVDPNPNPKKFLGDVLPVLIADNYTPSNSYSPYHIDGTLVLYVTAIDGRAGSQKAVQLQRIERAIHAKLDLGGLGVRAVRVCYGRTEEEAIQSCKENIASEYLEGAYGEPTTDPKEPRTAGNTQVTPSAPPQQTQLGRSAMQDTGTDDYQLRPDFDRARLKSLIGAFRAVVKRKQDQSLANKLERKLLESSPPTITYPTMQQLAKWCHTHGHIYWDGMEVARKISILLFGQVVDRKKFGV